MPAYIDFHHLQDSLVILGTHVFDSNIILCIYIYIYTYRYKHTHTDITGCLYMTCTCMTWSLNCLITSYPGPARLCGELRIGVHSTASTGGTAGEVGTRPGTAQPDPTRICVGFEGDAASNPGIKALYVEGFSEVRSVDSNAERDWQVQLAQEWYHEIW